MSGDTGENLVRGTYRSRVCQRTGETYYEHRAIAAWKLGRALLGREVVHHVNGDPTDNHPENLWVFSSQRAHMLWHHYCWREERGVGHLFPFKELLEIEGEWVAQ